MAKILVNCTYGQEDPERATLPFVVANVAATADQEVVVFLTIEAVRLGVKGYADSIHKEGLAPLREILHSVVANGGQLWLCSACAKPRGISDSDLVEGAKIVTAANLVEYATAGAVIL